MQALALTSDSDYYTRAANEDCINGGPRTRTKYEYDDYARLKRTAATVQATGTSEHDQTDYTGTYEFKYDEYSQLNSITYPQSLGEPIPLIVKRRYDPDTGQLIEIDDARSAKPRLLWKFFAGDAAGRATETVLGNNTREKKHFDAATSRLKSFLVNAAGGKSLLEILYDYDPAGNLKTRQDGPKSDLEMFDYDEQNRLISATWRGVTTKVEYDQDDRIRYKADVGKYFYKTDAGVDPKRCAPDSAPSAPCFIKKDGLVSDRFEYDESGSVLRHAREGLFSPPDQDIDYTADHHVERITSGGADPQSAEFFYGPAGQRILTREADGRRTKEVVHLGLYEKIAVHHRHEHRTDNTDRFYVAGDQGAMLTIDVSDSGRRGGSGRNRLHTTELYQHHDRLGSIVMLTKADGRSGARVRFDPWGKSAGDLHPERDQNTDLDITAAWTRGFTGQDHVADFGLVHMTGRVYDPRLGIFLSVDPLGGDSLPGSDLDPYLYARGNPFAVTDPTGYFGWSDVGNFLHDVGNAIGGAVTSIANAVSSAVQGAAQWVGQNWREIVTVAVIAVVSFVTAGTGTGPIVAAMAAGAAGGATETALYGGNLQDVIGAAIEGGIIGGFTAGLGGANLGWEANSFLRGWIGGIQSSINGKGFESGFALGALSVLSPSSINPGDTSVWGVAERIGASAVINGALSGAQGDKFANGALTGVFQQLYTEADQGRWQVKSLIEVAGALTPSVAKQLTVSEIMGVAGDIRQDLTSDVSRILVGYGQPGSFLDLLRSNYNDLQQFNQAVESIKPPAGVPGQRAILQF